MHAQPTVSEILAAFSHEIRTPLAAVRGAIQLLDEDASGGLTDDQQGFVELALRNVRRVESLLATIIESGRLEGDEWPVDPVPARLPALVQAAIDEVLDTTRSSRRVTLQAEPSMPLVPVDPEAFRRVVRNLVANAIRLTPARGEVTVRVRLTGDGACVEVADQGPGVPPDRREWIFGRFHRAGGGGGIGLGLHLSRRIAEAHGGTLSCVEPPAGTGACFRITVPLRRPTMQVRPKQQQRWITVQRRDDRPLSAAQTFRTAEALRTLAPAARRIERGRRVDAFVSGLTDDHLATLCGRISDAVGSDFEVHERRTAPEDDNA